MAITTINVSASDADGDTLTYSATGLPTGLSIDSSTGAISGTPTTAGTYSVTVSVSDGTDSASTSFTYTVNTVVVSTSSDVNFTQMILPDTGKTRTNFANSLASNGAYVVVGSKDESTDNAGNGVVYIYKYNTSNTLEKIYKINSNDVAQDFGASVAMSGDYIVVGDPTTNSSYDYGAAYVYKNNGDDTFSYIATLEASAAVSNENFGYSVAIDGNYIVIGSTKENAYVFKNDGSDNFTQLNKLVADDADGDLEHFGRKVAISGDFVFVTSDSDDPSGRTSAGSVYIYKNDGTDNFVQNQKIVSDTSGYYDYFGTSISADGSYLVVGEDSGGVSVTSSGSVDIFKKSDVNDSFIFLATLEANDAEAYSFFGGSVSISGDNIAVGAYYKDLNSTLANTGAVYFFTNDGDDTFTQVASITADDAVADNFIGNKVSLGSYGLVAGSSGLTNELGALYVYVSTSPTLVLDSISIELAEGATGDIVATATTDGTNADTVSASSSDTNVCTVAVSGNTITVTGVGAGSATVTVTSSSGVNKTVAVTVTSASTLEVLTLTSTNRIDVVTGENYYQFTTTDAGEYNITSSSYTEEADFSFTVYSSSDYADEVASVDTTSLSSESMSVTLSANTTYYLRIYDFNANISCDLTIAQVANTLATTTLTLGVKKEDTLEAGGELWYSFDATAGTDYQILTQDYDNDGNNYPGDVVASVYKADGETPYQYAVSSGGDASDDFVDKNIFNFDGLFIHTTSNEKVMIKINGWQNDSTGGFAITVTQQ